MNDPRVAAEQWYEFPCSKVQERFWAGEQLRQGSASLNIALRWRLQGPVDAEMIAHALRQLTARHEILRTAFRERDGRPVQKVLPTAPVHVPVVDLRLMARPDRDREFERICVEEARRPFDLTEAPLLRVQLLRLGERESFLLITAHHIVADGWSMGIIAREFCALCNGVITGTAPALPALPIQYSDYAVWEGEWQGTDLLLAEEAYWARRLSGLEPLSMPTDRPRAVAATPNSAITSILLPAEVTGAVESLARACGATWFIAVLTGLVLVLARRSGTPDVTVGTQVAGRDQPELEGVVGPFTNTILLRTDLADVATVAEALDRVGEAVHGALAHSHVQLERVLDMVKPRRGSSGRSLLAVNVLQQRAFDEVRCSDLTLQGIPSVSTGGQFDLNFFVVERGEGWRLSCEYDTGLFEEGTVAGMLAEALDLLGEAALDPRRPLAGFPLLRPEPESEPSVEPAPGPPQHHGGAAATETERRVLALWNDVLGRDGLSLDEAFFDTGGSSLDAVRLTTRITAQFGARLSLAAFLGNPTVRELARIVEGRTMLAGPEATTVTLQPEGSGTPIFAFHNTFLFRDLARRIGPERPFHCVVPADIYHAPGATYESVVAHYVEGIRRARPHGPYILLGHCFAARLAYEAAQQLTRAGEVVEHVIVLDGWAPGHMARKSWGRAMLSRLSYVLIRQVSRVRKLATGQISRARIAQRSRIGLGLEPAPEAEEIARIAWVEGRLAEHRIEPYHGPVLVVRALGEPHGLFMERDLAWREIAAGRLDLRDVPGTHFTMFQEPEVERLAAAIGASLDRGASPAGATRR